MVADIAESSIVVVVGNEINTNSLTLFDTAIHLLLLLSIPEYIGMK